LLKSTGRPIFDSRNGIMTPRLDLLSAVMQVLRQQGVKFRRRSVAH
jgi:hypothetical protein